MNWIVPRDSLAPGRPEAGPKRQRALPDTLPGKFLDESIVDDRSNDSSPVAPLTADDRFFDTRYRVMSSNDEHRSRSDTMLRWRHRNRRTNGDGEKCDRSAKPLMLSMTALRAFRWLFCKAPPEKTMLGRFQS